MLTPLSSKSRQAPTLSLSVAPPVNLSYTELSSAERAANTATVDFDTGRVQPDMSSPEKHMSTLAHATACTASVTGFLGLCQLRQVQVVGAAAEETLLDRKKTRVARSAGNVRHVRPRLVERHVVVGVAFT